MTITQQTMPTLHAPYTIYFSQILAAPIQETAAALLQQLSVEYIANIQPANRQLTQKGAVNTTMNGESVIIKNMVDGRGLACPMPLLKTKVALRDVGAGESLYVVATDPNSQADIVAFCQQTHKTQQSGAPALTLILNQVSTSQVTNSVADNHLDSAKPDTIFHFIITKTDTN
ncbi:sulfurtransferase TusA family protein [Psychrobacter sp. 16-MNA-CIBAN-0192]|uniref:sulfurtransferase TusA family protein n=1 Tax=Psychrobacter sp. 16-MNA-CIBAN-0192 TaxID=3140448 RepID=UPI003327BF83